ncbi:hypothetical protein [Dickeya undicola]|uniref:hypothetical protein n=1 Tax=Dickeya undicola TaxID=1577887 RepID=UPI000A9CD054|nr:hypothetical protein [Dickeya undicola]
MSWRTGKNCEPSYSGQQLLPSGAILRRDATQSGASAIVNATGEDYGDSVGKGADRSGTLSPAAALATSPMPTGIGPSYSVG